MLSCSFLRGECSRSVQRKDNIQFFTSSTVSVSSSLMYVLLNSTSYLAIFHLPVRLLSSHLASPLQLVQQLAQEFGVLNSMFFFWQGAILPSLERPQRRAYVCVAHSLALLLTVVAKNPSRVDTATFSGVRTIESNADSSRRGRARQFG